MVYIQTCGAKALICGTTLLPGAGCWRDARDRIRLVHDSEAVADPGCVGPLRDQQNKGNRERT